MTEVINVNLTVGRAYRLLKDFFSSQSDLKVKICLEPSSIKVKKTWSFFGGAFNVNIKLHSKKKESVGIECHFDFSEYYTKSIMAWVITLIFAWLLAFHMRPEFPIPLSLIIAIGYFLGMPRTIKKEKEKFMERVAYFFKGSGVKAYKELYPEVESTMKTEELYERLIHDYTVIHGGSKLALDREIESYVKMGLSREEAIRKLAEEKL